MINLLQEKFVQEVPLTVQCGKMHDYLRMVLDFSTPGKVQIQMYDHIDKVLAKVPTDMDGTTAMAAAEDLFIMDPKPELVEEATAVLFHHNFAKLMFLCICAQ